MRYSDRDSVLGNISLLANTEKIEIISKEFKVRKKESWMPINSLDDALNLSLKKSLIDFSITDKMLEKLDQSDEAIFTPCDKGINIGDALRDEDV